jgi:exodeoxyribonuclease VII large subunit
VSPRARGTSTSSRGLFDEPAPTPRAATAPATAGDGESAETAIAVSTLALAAKDILEGAIPRLWVRGEVSGFKQYPSGHWYFTLRDANGALSCAVWNAKSKARTIPTAPDEGMTVVALGRLTVYPAKGQLQFSIDAMEAAGEGLWRKQFEEARARLEADGLLDPARKRPLPRVPRRIAVVTSAQGAALQDIIVTAKRRAPAVELVVVPCLVQGDEAPASIIAALERVRRWNGCDVVIVGRGGGSREDLWAFNDEGVARAVAASPVPIISAVGHEVDISLTDLVADWRAATPTAAAEAAVPVWTELQEDVRRAAIGLRDALQRRAARSRQRFDASAKQLALLAQRTVERRRARLAQGSARLHALSPLATLGRGFSVARSEDGTALTSAAQFAAGTAFSLLLKDGRVQARAESVDRSAPEAE